MFMLPCLGYKVRIFVYTRAFECKYDCIIRKLRVIQLLNKNLANINFYYSLYDLMKPHSPKIGGKNEKSVSFLRKF